MKKRKRYAEFITHLINKSHFYNFGSLTEKRE